MIISSIKMDMMWGIINKLEKQGLLEVKRDGRKVIGFIPNEDIELLLEQKTDKE